MSECCATCKHAEPVRVITGFNSELYRHCSNPPNGYPVVSWMIGAKSGCGHTPSQWEIKKE